MAKKKSAKKVAPKKSAALSFLEFRLDNGLVISGLMTDEQWDAVLPDFKANGAAKQGTMIERLAAAVKRARSVRYSTSPSPAAHAFHRQGET